MLGPVLRISDEVSRLITAGDREVFAEPGELFAAFIETFEDEAREGVAKPEQLEHFLARFRPGPARPDRLTRGDHGELLTRLDGGQDLLRDAMVAYHAALFEADSRARAQLILYGNALGGLHEQTRLQSYIVGALHAPLTQLFVDRQLELIRARMGGELRGSLVEAVRPLLSELGEEVFESVREASTFAMMTMAIPGELLRLGRDLPAPPGGPLYPPALDPIEHAKLAEILAEYGAHDAPASLWLRLRGRIAALRHGRVVAVGSAARDWGELAERMRFIFCYFRSRQREQSLFESPFSDEQTRELVRGRIPDGPL